MLKIVGEKEEIEKFEWNLPKIFPDKKVEKKILKLWELDSKEIEKIGVKGYGKIISKRIKEIRKMKENGKKVVGYLCNFIPEELIYASNCIPLRVCCGIYESINVAEKILPMDVCPLIKSSFGSTLSKLLWFDLCDVIILPTSCDGKKKLAEFFSKFKDVWILHLPNLKTEDEFNRNFLPLIKVLKEDLEKLSKKRISRDELEKSIKLFHKRTEVFRKLNELRKKNQPPINGIGFNLILFTSFFEDVERWIKNINLLYKKLERKDSKFSEYPKVMLIGSPIIWPNFKLLKIVEEFAVVVNETMCSFEHLYTPVEVDDWSYEGMIRALARKYFLPSICPCFLGNDIVDRILQRIEDYKIDGIIYHQLKNCLLFDMEYYKIKFVLEKKGTPLLRIQTDYAKEDVEQIRTRVETFINIIKGKYGNK